MDQHKSLPRWEEILKNFEADIFPDIVPLRHPKKRNYDDKVHVNIKRSNLHLVTTRPPIFPCMEVIKWIINHSNTEE